MLGIKESTFNCNCTSFHLNLAILVTVGSCWMPVFNTKTNITAVCSTLKQDDERPIRCKERDLLLSSRGVEGTDDCPLRPCGDHTALPAVALVSSKGSSPGAMATSLSPFLSCSPIPVELRGSRGWCPPWNLGARSVWWIPAAAFHGCYCKGSWLCWS